MYSLLNAKNDTPTQIKMKLQGLDDLDELEDAGYLLALTLGDVNAGEIPQRLAGENVQ